MTSVKNIVPCKNYECKSKCKLNICKKRTCNFHQTLENYLSLCSNCYKSMFPFMCIDNDDLINMFTDTSDVDNSAFDILNTQDIVVENDESINDAIDPDINFYDKINVNKSLYYTTEKIINIKHKHKHITYKLSQY